MRITIIGCGNMGAAIAGQLSPHHTLNLYDRNSDKTKIMESDGHGTSFSELNEALLDAEMIILAIKPQNLKEFASEVKDYILPAQLLISLLAGTPISALKQTFPSTNIIRMMPNLAIAFGEGLVGLTSDEKLEKQTRDAVTSICETLGKVFWMPESKLDAFTSLAGSGPAFVCTIVESMIDAGIAMGLTSEDSKVLVSQMIKGSLTLLDKTDKHPGELKWQIASPGGTTIAGLQKLEDEGVRGKIIATFIASYRRARELSAFN